MLLRLARQTFVRHFGEFTYIFGKVASYDQVFCNAEAFLRYITRQPQEREAILSRISAQFPNVDRQMLVRDFDDFIDPLVAEKIILKGEVSDELDRSEPMFTYDCENPKTVGWSSVYVRREGDSLPATILER